jgi:hypothetical protein
LEDGHSRKNCDNHLIFVAVHKKLLPPAGKTCLRFSAALQHRSAGCHSRIQEGKAMTSMLNVQSLSPGAFAHLGLEQVAYVKKVTDEAEQGFAIHAADGTRLAVAPDRATAVAAIRDHDMEPMALH